MASESIFVLPGDRIDPSLVPTHPKKPLRLGPGLRHVPPSDILPTLAGELVSDRNKNAIRVETAGGRVSRIQSALRHVIKQVLTLLPSLVHPSSW